MEMIPTKFCPVCKITKNVHEFYFNSKNASRSYSCRDCTKAYRNSKPSELVRISKACGDRMHYQHQVERKKWSRGKPDYGFTSDGSAFCF